MVEYQPKRAEAIRQLLPRFESEMAARGHPVTVALEPLDLTDEEFRVELSMRYAKGRGPDVTSHPTAWTPDLAAEGYLLDLSERVAAWPDWQRFYEVLRERAVAPDGRIYAIPRGATIIQLFYRRDVLEALGVSTEQPRSWDELVGRAVELRDAIGAPSLLIPAGSAWLGGTFDEGFINLMLGTDSPLYDETTGRWVVRSPGLTAVFGLYERLTADRLLPVGPLLEPEPWEATKYQTFVDGDLPIVTQGTWGWTFDWGPDGRRPIDGLRERVGTWAFPAADGGEPFVWGSEAWGWTVDAQTAHPDEAWELVRWLSSGEALATDLVAVGNLSPRDDIRDLEPYADQPALVAEEPLLAIGRSFQPRVGIEQVRVVVGEVTDEIIIGRATGEEAADLFARRLRERLGADAVTEAP